MNNKKGKFIAFEGLDGAGLTTQSQLLTDFLRKKGQEVISTKEPTIESEAGRKIKQILDEKIKAAPDEIQKLFIEDRKHHLENLIMPSLDAGKIVISDRYFFSTIAFGAINNDFDWLVSLNKDFLLPNITFLLMVRPEVCVRRIERRGEGIKFFEKIKKLKKAYKNYEKIAGQFKNVVVIDGEKSIEEVFHSIREKVYLILGERFSN
jgi:dTMP kinase